MRKARRPEAQPDPTLTRAEAALLEAFEAEARREEAATAATVAELELWERSGGGEEGEAVRCPVCARRRLVVSRGVVLCSCGGLRLDLAAEGGTLARVREALAEAWQVHAAACRAEPAFQQRAAPGGGEHLWLTCQHCSAFAAVL